MASSPQKEEILYGVHPVAQALAAGRRKTLEIFLAGNSSSKRIRQAMQLAQTNGIPVKQVDARKLDSLCNSGGHQGIGARVTPYPTVDFQTIVTRDRKEKTAPFLLFIDSVLDPHNLGALVRTATAIGVDGIVIPKDRSAKPTPLVSKTSAGALEHARLAIVTNLTAAIQQVRDQHIWVVGTAVEADLSIYQADLTIPLALVIGGEEKGLRRLIKENCDLLVSIPQRGAVQSLNASVAGGVVLYEAYRQRLKAN